MEGLPGRIKAETKEGVHKNIEERAQEHALELVRARFETGPEENRLAYHNSSHTEGVIRRALKIAEALELSEEQKRLVVIAASFHDVVQEWEPQDKGEGVVFRKRKIGDNERAAAEEAVAWMKEQEDGDFTEADYELVRSAIQITEPDWDIDNKTVMQKGLNETTDPTIRAAVLADLSSGAMEPETFKEEGRQLFIEEQLDIIEALKRAESPSDIPEAVQQAYQTRYRTWLSVQEGFVRGREARFKTELAGIDEKKIERVHQLFSRFDESIQIANDNVAEANQQDFITFARTLVPGAFRLAA
ncbi:MAG: HD domain-containing protein [Patescibacteria group bacterium]